ncbi:MAG: TetR/AcrR family transcriptional regulator [Pseudonocardiales bacterium]
MAHQQWHCGPAGCPPHGKRRRGEALEQAILAAAVRELAEVGYDAMTVEGVAARAHTGKAALYRRWPAKEDLVVDALHFMLPPCGALPDTGSVRDDLVELLSAMAATIRTPAGTAMQRMLGSQRCAPEILETVHGKVIGPRREMLLEALRRGAQRGEVRPDAVTVLVAQVGSAMILQHLADDDRPVDRRVVEEIVDQVVMPLLRP